MKKFVIRIYNENEELLLSSSECDDDIDKLFNASVLKYGCDKSIEFKWKNSNWYGYIKHFDCYGRLDVEQI